MKRRDFVQQAVLAGTSGGLAEAGAVAAGEAAAPAELPRIGPKEVARSKRAVATSQHPIVTETMLEVMREGGNAADAAVAGCLVQATVQQEMTNHTGTVDFLFWEARYVLEVESRLGPEVVAGLAKLGISVSPLPAYDYHMGSFQMSWRDAQTGQLASSADPRRAGQAGGL